MNIILQKKSTAAALFTVLLMLLATPVFSQVTRGRLNKCGSDVSLQDVLANPVSARLYREGNNKLRKFFARPQQSPDFDITTE